MSMCAAVQEAKCLIQLLKDMTVEVQHKTVLLNADNQGAIALAKNPVYHQRSKLIDIRYHFVRSEVQNGFIQLQYIPLENNVADMFTKALSSVKLKQFIPNVMGITEQ